MLASAVYTGGTQALSLGTRYVIAIRRDDLQIRGPVDVDPNAVVASRPLAALEIVGLVDRFVINSADTSRDRFIVGFTNVTGMPVDALERTVAGEQARIRGEDARS